ncbi:hypothetical protein HAX54_026532 [Datura stramonium]|uniref:VQ domain-containing protein n=1 Tax=Datura stramonium TaxID=4076 RepID=A0ABS8S7Y4_DATST|nr:hypothetical protein [Datura stramonium]
MEKMLTTALRSKKANEQKQLKTTKRKTVKVVYISNPMKVKTSAAEFRALVQQLTGQHAKYPVVAETTDACGGGTGFEINECDKQGLYFAESSLPSGDQQVVRGDTELVLPNNNYHVSSTEAATMTDNSDLSFEDYVGEDYVPELLENLPSNSWYD